MSLGYMNVCAVIVDVCVISPTGTRDQFAGE